MTKANASQKQLIDSTRLRGDLAAIHARHGRSDTDLRTAILVRLKEAMAHGRAVAESRLGADGRGTRCAANLSYIQDEIIRALCDFIIDCVYTARNPSAAERLCVVAVGGYGRGTLGPARTSTSCSCSPTSRPRGARAWSNTCSTSCGTSA
jgi:[protein-PII] uridylyltransferase